MRAKSMLPIFCLIFVSIPSKSDKVHLIGFVDQGDKQNLFIYKLKNKIKLKKRNYFVHFPYFIVKKAETWEVAEFGEKLWQSWS